MAGAITRALLEKQELVDSARARRPCIEQLVPRETAPGARAARVGARSARARSDALARRGDARARRPSAAGGTSRLARAPRLRDRAGARGAPRRGRDAARCTASTRCARRSGGARAHALVEQLRATLDEIAFKRGSALVLEQPQRARRARARRLQAVVGLMANPSAPPPTPPGSRSTCTRRSGRVATDLPVQLRRASASCAASPPASATTRATWSSTSCRSPRTLSPICSREQAPPGQDLGRGRPLPPGAARLRLGRRADARARGRRSGRGCRATCASTRLQRPLTREEKLQRAWRYAPSDLVGRDAEKADLHAAYHGVVGAGRRARRRSCRASSPARWASARRRSSAPSSPSCRRTRACCASSARRRRASCRSPTLGEWLRELTGTRARSAARGGAARSSAHALGDALEGTEPSRDRRAASASSPPGALARATTRRTWRAIAALLVTGIRHAFTRARAAAPLVVVLDGLQWADEQSLELVAEL